VLASSETVQGASAELKCLIEGYRLCATSEGKSPNTIDIVTNSVNYFHDFLCSSCLPTDVRDIGPREIRAFILHLQQYAWADWDSQKWRFEYVPGGYYRIVSKYSDKVMDVFAYRTEDGAEIRQWTSNGAENQLWKIEAR
jgi:hypothetical protein